MGRKAGRFIEFVPGAGRDVSALIRFSVKPRVMFECPCHKSGAGQLNIMRSSLQIIDITRRAASLVLALALLIPAAAAAQTRRGQSPQRKGATAPAGGAGKGSAAEPKVDLTKLVPAPKSKALGAAFTSGRLPPPASMPEGSVEEQAIALAAKLAAGDEGSTAALYAAMLASGYGVREEGGAVRRPAGGAGQGLVIDAWQLAATAKLYGEGYGVGLDRIGTALGAMEPGFTGAPVAELLAKDLRLAARSENDALRFWANFIVELGRQADEPYDLLTGEGLSRARLDAVQLNLILTRLAADFHVLGKQGRRTATAERRRPRAGNVRFANASFTRASFAPESPAAAAPPAAAQEPTTAAAQPCQLGEVESIILDYNATALTTAFGELSGYLEGKGAGSIVKWSKIAQKANILLTVLKFFATYAAVNAVITLDGEELTRTKTTQDGERRVLTAKLAIDTGKWQVMNCIRPALNAAGLDFSLPGSGAMAGVRVVWRLAEGGDTRGYWGRVWHTASNLKDILAGKMVANDGGALVYLDPAAGAKGDAEKHHYSYTDDNGESKTPVVGHGQEKDLSKLPLKVVHKAFGVKVDIQVKTMRIKDAKGAVGTLGDLAGNVIAALTGDLLGAGVGTVAESLYRSNWHSSQTFYFPVRDWAPCDGGWRGVVSIVRELRENRNDRKEHFNGAQTVHNSNRRYGYEAKLNITPGGEGDVKATAVAAVSDLSTTYESTAFRETCGDSVRLFIHDGQTTRITQGAFFDDDASVNIYEKSPGVFNLSFGVAGFNARYTVRQQEDFKNHCEEYCDHKPSDETTGGEESVDREAVTLEDVKADPGDLNRLMGRRTIDDGLYKVTVIWSLSRCEP